MSALTVEGIVKDGQIKLDPKFRLPEGAKVYVVVPGIHDSDIEQHQPHLHSPRLKHPEQASEFDMDIRQA